MGASRFCPIPRCFVKCVTWEPPDFVLSQDVLLSVLHGSLQILSYPKMFCKVCYMGASRFCLIPRCFVKCVTWEPPDFVLSQDVLLSVLHGSLQILSYPKMFCKVCYMGASRFCLIPRCFVKCVTWEPPDFVLSQDVLLSVLHVLSL